MAPWSPTKSVTSQSTVGDSDDSLDGTRLFDGKTEGSSDESKLGSSDESTLGSFDRSTLVTFDGRTDGKRLGGTAMGDALGDFLALEDFVASGLFLRRACASFAAATSIKNGNTRRLRFMISIAVALIINFYDIERKINCLFLLKQIRFHNYPNLIQMDLWNLSQFIFCHFLVHDDFTICE
jgi:hypothetical protein